MDTPQAPLADESTTETTALEPTTTGAAATAVMTSVAETAMATVLPEQETEPVELTLDDLVDEDDEEAGIDEAAVYAAYEARINELREEFGEKAVSGIVVDVEFYPEVSAFYADALPRIEEALAVTNGKVRMALVREPGEELYLVGTVHPRKWNPQWLAILQSREGYNLYWKELLSAALIHPLAEEIAWDWEDGKVYAPSAMVAERLVTQFFSLTFPAPSDPAPAVFGAEEAGIAGKIAARKKPASI